MNLALILTLLGTLCGAYAQCDNSVLPELTFRLTGSTLEFPCHSTKNIYITTGRYLPRNVIATRSQIYRDEAFVAMPRYKPGVPFTLGRISLKRGSCYSQVQPFPCWSMQEEGTCEALQSVVDIFLDAQDILWVLDVGIVHTLEQPIRRCPPKVLGISVKTGKVLHETHLTNVVLPNSRLQYVVADYDKDGKPFIFIADAGGRAIIVHDCTSKKTHRVLLPSAIASSTEDDVMYMVLVRKSDQHSVLYFTYLNIPRLYSIRTENLHQGEGSGSVVDHGSKSKPVVLLGSDNGAGLFLRYKGENNIYMWNTNTAFKDSNFVEVQSGGECRLATQVMPGHRKFMWTIESNFHDYIDNKVGCNGACVAIHPVIRQCD